MPDLTLELHVNTRGKRFVTLANLINDAELRRSLAIDLDAEPDGGLAITDNSDMVLVDDILTDVAGFFLDVLPDLLREGRGDIYHFRTGPERVSVEPQGVSVVITNHDDGTWLKTTTVQLLDCLERAKQDYELLESLTAKN